jgi:hypothetical protein
MLIIPLIVLSVVSSEAFSQDKTMTIQFLGMKEGCPNTPKMWISLNEALRELRWNITVDSLDVFVLADQEDLRAGYGSPTILVNGTDLFDAPKPKSFNPACRFYRGGVPGTNDIIERLRRLGKAGIHEP